jgi:hypothetical protein
MFIQVCISTFATKYMGCIISKFLETSKWVVWKGFHVSTKDMVSTKYFPFASRPLRNHVIFNIFFSVYSFDWYCS